MQNTPRLLTAVMALPLAFALAVPATAGPRDGQRYGQEYRQGNGWSETRQNIRNDRRRDNRAERRIEQRLDELKREIRQARRSGVLNRYQARNFRNKLDTLTRGYHAFARNGLSRRDIRVTMRRIGNVNDQLAAKRYQFAQRGYYSDRRGDRRGNYRRTNRDW